MAHRIEDEVEFGDPAVQLSSSLLFFHIQRMIMPSYRPIADSPTQAIGIASTPNSTYLQSAW